MKKLRVLVLMHENLVPPDSLEGYSDKEILEWKTEYDVLTTLKEMGHEGRPLGVSDNLGVIRQAIEEWKPHICFNLLEEFHGITAYDQHVVSFLELMRQPYTGCNPRGMMLARDKSLSKKLLTYHRIPTPRWGVITMRAVFKPSSRLKYPLIVKSATEDASLAISQNSVVYDEEKLRERVTFVHEQTKSDALVEEYIEGRELYVGVLGNQRLQTLPIWEMAFKNLPEGTAKIATRKVKWDQSYQEKYGIATGAAKNLPPEIESQILKLCKRIYRTLELTGYARMDLRLKDDGRMLVLEANPNPNLSYGEDFAESAEKAGIKYDELIQRIITLGISYKAAWKVAE